MLLFKFNFSLWQRFYHTTVHYICHTAVRFPNGINGMVIALATRRLSVQSPPPGRLGNSTGSESMFIFLFAEHRPLQISTGIPPSIWFFDISAGWWANHAPRVPAFSAWLIFSISSTCMLLCYEKQRSTRSATQWNITTHHPDASLAFLLLSHFPWACVDQGALRLLSLLRKCTRLIMSFFVSE